MTFSAIRYETAGRIARITLNRPERLNAMSAGMPAEIAAAVALANDDDSVHVIILQGEGKGFGSGYDLKDFAEAPGENAGVQDMPWDPMRDYRLMKACTDHFSSLWRSYKPTIAKVHHVAVAGGSDIALACDFVILGEEARIGYPPARVLGCPPTALWGDRPGAGKGKRMPLTGGLVRGRRGRGLGGGAAGGGAGSFTTPKPPAAGVRGSTGGAGYISKKTMKFR